LDLECLQINSQKAEAGISEPILPLSYRSVQHVDRNLITQPLVKDVQSVGTNSFYEEKPNEQAWMTAVHDTLYMDSDTERGTPVVWSSFDAARSDAVGQPENGIGPTTI